MSKSPTESQSNYNTFVRIAYLFSYHQKITKTDLKETEIDVVFIKKNIYISLKSENRKTTNKKTKKQNSYLKLKYMFASYLKLKYMFALQKGQEIFSETPCTRGEGYLGCVSVNLAVPATPWLQSINT